MASDFVSQPLQPNTGAPVEEHMFAVRDEAERAIILNGHPLEIEFLRNECAKRIPTHRSIDASVLIEFMLKSTR